MLPADAGGSDLAVIIGHFGDRLRRKIQYVVAGDHGDGRIPEDESAADA